MAPEKWWCLKNAHIRLVVVLLILIRINEVDVGILGDGRGGNLHYVLKPSLNHVKKLNCGLTEALDYPQLVPTKYSVEILDLGISPVCNLACIC